jgi:hypothetical protein
MRHKTRKGPLNPDRLSQLLLALLGTQYDVIRVLVEPKYSHSLDGTLFNSDPPNFHLGIADTLTFLTINLLDCLQSCDKIDQLRAGLG